MNSASGGGSKVEPDCSHAPMMAETEFTLLPMTLSPAFPNTNYWVAFLLANLGLGCFFVRLPYSGTSHSVGTAPLAERSYRESRDLLSGSTISSSYRLLNVSSQHDFREYHEGSPLSLKVYKGKF